MSPAAAIVAGVGLLGVTIALARVPLQRLAFVTVGMLVLTITWNGVRIGGGAFGDGFLALAVITVLAHVVVNRRSVFIPPWLLATAAGLIVAALVESMFPPGAATNNVTALQFNQAFVTAGIPITVLSAPRSNVSALVKFEIALLIVPVLIPLVATSVWRINRLLDLWTISATINGLVGVLDYLGFHALAPVAINGHRSSGLTVHPNYLALTCALAMPTALRWVGRSRRGTQAGLAATAILIGGVYASGSRDGLVAAGIALVVSIALMPRLQHGLRYAIPPLGIVLVAVLLFTHAGHSIVNQLRLGGPTQSTVGSDYQRSVAAHVAETQIRARPIAGVGFAVDNDAQNIYLQLLAAGGVIAMGTFLIFLGGLISCVRRVLHGPLREEAIAIAICTIVWLINGYYDSQVADKYLYVLPGILIACTRVRSARPPSAAAEPAHDGAEPAPARTLAPIGAGVAAL